MRKLLVLAFILISAGCTSGNDSLVSTTDGWYLYGEYSTDLNGFKEEFKRIAESGRQLILDSCDDVEYSTIVGTADVLTKAGIKNLSFSSGYPNAVCEQ